MRAHPKSARGGFTLLELIVVVSIVSLLAGAMIPVAMVSFHSKARSDTVDELRSLGAAVGQYYRDTWQLPSDLDDLFVDPSVSGWAGPYLTDASIDVKSGVNRYTVDGWSLPYTVSVSGPVFTMVSAGVDRTAGNADDLSLSFDTTPLVRERTRAQLETVNQAITLYNATWMASDPLPADYAALLNQLVLRGYLPSSAAYLVDGWGDAFEPCPAGVTPVVQVISTHLDNGSCF